MQRQLVRNLTFIFKWGQGTCSLTKHKRRWAYSGYFLPTCCLLRFAAFLEVRAPLGPLDVKVKVKVKTKKSLEIT